MANTIITIGRQFGSGGREIGKKISEKLGISFYDKELLNRAAADSGICRELFETHDENAKNTFWSSLVSTPDALGYPPTDFFAMPIHHKVFQAQFNTIRQIANEGACVIIGRCADAALADNENVLSVFIYADKDARIDRIAKKHEITVDAAKDMIKKTDKQRAAFYNYYTSKKWGDLKSYDLTLNSSVFGIDGCVDLIIESLNKR